MNARARKLTESVAASLWAIPTLCFVLSIAAAVGALAIDRALGERGVRESMLLFPTAAESARSVLGTIAGSVITVMGTVFSVTIVALTLVSQQFTPRVFPLFIHDRTNQTVMGVFLATFAYSIIVLRTVRSVDERLFVPTVAVTGGVVLALASVAALIYFIHHLATTLQVSSIVANLSAATHDLLEHPFPDGCGAPSAGGPEPADDAWAPVSGSQDGYLQVVDGDLIEFAARHDIVVRMEHSVGDFIPRGMAVVSVAPAERLDDRLRAGVAKHFALGERRTMQQDASYGVRQIVDIALKALSPSSNDPTTAANCVDHLGAIVYRIAGREDPAARRADRAGRLRLIARATTFESITRHAFDQVRHDAARDVAVTIRVLERLRDVGTAVRRDDRRDLLWTQATTLTREAGTRIDGDGDRAAVDDRMRALAEVVRRDGAQEILGG